MTQTTGPFRSSLFLFLLILTAAAIAEPIRENPNELFYLGNLYRAENRYDEALKTYERVLLLNPRHEGALLALTELSYSLGNYAECARYARRALQSARPEDPELLFYLGSAMSYSSRAEDGVAVLRRAVELEPRRARWWMELGKIEQELNRPAEARRCFERALELDKRSAAAAQALGELETAAGNPGGARGWFEKAAAWDPGWATPVFSLGLLAFDKGDWPSAEKFFRRAIEIQHVHIGAFFHLALLEEKKGNRLAQYYWLDRAFPYLRRDEKAKAEEVMGRLEKDCGLDRAPMQSFVRHDPPVALGEGAEAVRARLGEPAYRHQNGNLWIYPKLGISVGFDGGTVSTIRLDAEFRGKIHGVELGEEAQKWERIYGNPHRSGEEFWEYRFQNEVVTLTLKTGKIKTVVLSYEGDVK